MNKNVIDLEDVKIMQNKGIELNSDLNPYKPAAERVSESDKIIKDNYLVIQMKDEAESKNKKVKIKKDKSCRHIGWMNLLSFFFSFFAYIYFCYHYNKIERKFYVFCLGSILIFFK